jgi:predicted XRE-type DNA-binding protein
MSIKRQNAAELAQFYATLKSDLVDWIEETGTKQAVLASMLGIDVSRVSHAVRPNGSITENFIRKLSDTIPRFRDAYPTLYRLKYGNALPSGAHKVGDAARVRAERIARLRAAEEEVISAVRAMTQAAIDLTARD